MDNFREAVPVVQLALQLMFVEQDPAGAVFPLIKAPWAFLKPLWLVGRARC